MCLRTTVFAKNILAHHIFKKIVKRSVEVHSFFETWWASTFLKNVLNKKRARLLNCFCKKCGGQAHFFKNEMGEHLFSKQWGNKKMCLIKM